MEYGKQGCTGSGRAHVKQAFCQCWHCTKPTNWLRSCIEVCSRSLQVESARNEAPRIPCVISGSHLSFACTASKRRQVPRSQDGCKGVCPTQAACTHSNALFKFVIQSDAFPQSVAFGVHHWHAQRITLQVCCRTACSRYNVLHSNVTFTMRQSPAHIQSHSYAGTG
jgi:hypothetical protein